MAQIARWTTPTIIYKPSAVEVSTIQEIFMVISINNREVLKKDIEAASVASGSFSWVLTQEETAKLTTGTTASIKIDYKCHNGTRYTTNPRKYTVVDSAVNEVI